MIEDYYTIIITQEHRNLLGVLGVLRGKKITLVIDEKLDMDIVEEGNNVLFGTSRRMITENLLMLIKQFSIFCLFNCLMVGTNHLNTLGIENSIFCYYRSYV